LDYIPDKSLVVTRRTFKSEVVYGITNFFRSGRGMPSAAVLTALFRNRTEQRSLDQRKSYCSVKDKPERDDTQHGFSFRAWSHVFLIYVDGRKLQWIKH